jgi:hypothetical protein
VLGVVSGIMACSMFGDSLHRALVWLLAWCSPMVFKRWPVYICQGVELMRTDKIYIKRDCYDGSIQFSVSTRTHLD